MRARFFVPSLGRFASADTIVPEPGNPQTLNRYSYTIGNPLKYKDPSGHCIPGETCPGDYPGSVPPVYWGDMSEIELAAFQGDQGPHNDCGAFSSAAGINMLTGTNLDGADMADLADLKWPKTRIFPGQAILPQQQVNLINKVDDFAEKHNAPIQRFSAFATTGTKDQLIDLLKGQNNVVILTVQWANPDNLITDSWEGHAMVLAAFDPTHTDESGNEKPWGFVNSWGKYDTLTWFSYEELDIRWGGNLWFVEENAIVVIELEYY